MFIQLHFECNVLTEIVIILIMGIIQVQQSENRNTVCGNLNEYSDRESLTLKFMAEILCYNRTSNDCM